MNFIEAVRSGFRNYASASGRAARSEFWYWALFNFIVGIAAGILDAIIGIGILDFIATFGLLLPSIAVGIRRLHDIDRSGWWLLIGFTGIGLILLLVWDCFKGTAGPNRFGEDPLAAA